MRKLEESGVEWGCLLNNQQLLFAEVVKTGIGAGSVVGREAQEVSLEHVQFELPIRYPSGDKQLDIRV